MAGGTDLGLAYAAIPTSIAAVLGARYGFLAARSARRQAEAPGPSAVDLEKRVTETEALTAVYSQLLTAKDDQLADRDARIERQDQRIMALEAEVAVYRRQGWQAPGG